MPDRYRRNRQWHRGSCGDGRLRRQAHRLDSADAGFTLVEAAIVLVVIGLILGVVLQGQSLIRNAEYRALKSQISDYQSAYYGFRDRYNGLPGDFADANDRLGGLANGGGNGVIDDGPACSADTDESCRAWQHLRGAGLIGGDPGTSGPPASPSHPYAGVFSSLFTGGDGNGVFADKLLITGLPGNIASRLDDDIDDDTDDSGRVSCSGCGADGYPGEGATASVVFEL